jgi:hypothetical protein
MQESDIMRKLDTRRTSTVDGYGNVVNIGDYCTVEGTQQAQRPGSTAKSGPQGGERSAHIVFQHMTLLLLWCP